MPCSARSPSGERRRCRLPPARGSSHLPSAAPRARTRTGSGAHTRCSPRTPCACWSPPAPISKQRERGHLMSHNCCNDFTRAQALRRAAAQTGRAMAPRDTRAPAPAGKGLGRRQFLLRSAGVMLSVYGASKLDLRVFEEGIAQAAASDRVLVSVFMPGGVDSISVLAPVGDPHYRRLRPRLALGDAEGTAFSEDGRLRWHPSATGLATLHAEGKATVMPAVGYDHPDQSHFNSRHVYEVGALQPKLATGWMGRYLDRVGRPDNPLQGLSLSGDLSPALATANVPVAAIDGPGDYDFHAPGVWGEVESWMMDAFQSIGNAHA